MALRTGPSTPEYDAGHEATFGKRCFYCKQPLDRDAFEGAEWRTSAHLDCEQEAQARHGEVAPAPATGESS